MHQLTTDEVNLVRTTCARDANEDEFKLFMHVAKKSRLDPILKQIYCLIFHTKRGRQMVIITGIGGFRSMAARDHKDYGGTSEAKFVWPDDVEKTPANRLIPFSATVTAFRKGGQFGSATVYWEEFAPVDLREDRADFWNRMPKHMLAKCAEAHALRKMFPGLNNIFTEEEMSSRLQDLTEGGREFHIDGQAPSGRIVDREAYGKAETKKVAQQRLDDHAAHGHAPGTPQAKLAEAQLAKVEEEDRRVLAAKNVTPKAPPAPKEPIWPKRQEDPGAQKDAPATGGGDPQNPSQTVASGPQLVNGTIHRTIMGMTRNNVPKLSVKMNNVWYECYVNSIFEFMSSATGQVAEVYLDKHKAIVGLKRVGRQEFEDGKIPVVQNKDREAGQKTLYP